MLISEKTVVSQLTLAIEEEVEIRDLYSLLNYFPQDLEDLYSSILGKIDQRLWPDTINFFRILEVKERYETDTFVKSLFDLGGATEDPISVVNNLLHLSCAIQDPISAVTCKAYFEADFDLNDSSLPHNQCAQVKRRLQRSCRGFIDITDAEDLPKARVTVLHLTVRDYLDRSQRYKEMLDQVDKRLLRDPALAIMAMFLRLLKCYPQYSQRDSFIKGFFRAMSSAELSTATSQIAYVEELNRVLFFTDPDWTTTYYKSIASVTDPSSGTDILSLAVLHGLAFYLEHQIGTNGKDIIHKTSRRPLLFYTVDGLVREMQYDIRISTLNTFELLLSNGADPMETFEGRTPWSYWVDHFSSAYSAQNGVPKIFKHMLEHGADPTKRHRPHASYGYRYGPSWPPKLQGKHYSTTFHVILVLWPYWRESYYSTVQLLVDHCQDLEATDSDGIGIQEWADSLNLEMGAFLRQEIAAKKQRLRRRIH